MADSGSLRGETIVYVAHPTVNLDTLAAPWIHTVGTISGFEQLGRNVRLLDLPVVRRAFALRSTGPGGRAARGLARLALPPAILWKSVERGTFLYVRHYHDLAIAYPLLRLLRRPFAVEVNATLLEEPHGLSGAPSMVQKLAAVLEMAMLRTAPRVVAVSGVLRDRLVDRGLSQDRVSVVHNASEVSAAMPAADPAAGRGILYVGNFKPWHRVDLLLRAYAHVAGELRHELRLVGSGDVSDLRALAGDLGIAESTRFIDKCGRGDVENLMGESAVLVLPNTEEYGSPLKLFEYLASGRPAVLPDLPNIREVVVDGEHAVLFAPGDAMALAEALRSVLCDRGRGDRMAERARELIRRNYTWRQNAEKILSAIGMADDAVRARE